MTDQMKHIHGWENMPEERKQEAARAYELGERIMKVVLRHSRDSEVIAANALTNILGTVLLNFDNPAAAARDFAQVLVNVVEQNVASMNARGALGGTGHREE